MTSGLAVFLTSFPKLSFIPTVIARIVSSLLNFFMNKKMVFRSDVRTGKALLRYYALAIPQLLAQTLLEMAVFTLFGITAAQAGLRTFIHIIIMTILFIISFSIQQRWVFAPQKTK